MTPDEARFALMRLIEQNPDLDQRGLAAELGMSLGKTNYCLRALVEKGHVKLGNFKRSQNKRGYRYKLTPAGVAEKLRQASKFLERKQRDYELLRQEIEALSDDLDRARKTMG